ncbi:MAG: hypothetical protein AAGG56_09775 [Pseudomonadota bacterium]
MVISVNESLELLAMMGGGGLLAVGGFWLMLREGPGGAGAKIGLGNAQVSASTAGFAVFFSGLATFSAPIVAPTSTHNFVNKIAPANMKPGIAETNFVQAGGHVAPDYEPHNDRIEGATLVGMGELVGGTHSGTDVDWYWFDLSAQQGEPIAVEIAENSQYCRSSFFNLEREHLRMENLSAGLNQIDIDPGSSERVYVKLDCAESAAVSGYTIAYDRALR